MSPHVHIHLRRRTALGATAITAALALVLTGCSSSSTEAAGSGAAAGCTPADKFSTVNEGTLTVATYEFQPHTILSGDGLSGIEGDLLTEIAKRECLTLTVDSAGGASASVPSVQSGRADLAAGDWWRTKARSEIVSLSDPVYLDQGAIITTTDAKTLEDLKGKKVASTVGNLWNDDLTTNYGDNFTVYQDAESEFADLAAGRIDAIVDSVGATVNRFKTAPIEGAEIVPLQPDVNFPSSAHPGQLNWPNTKDNPELTAAINAQIAALRADGTIAKTLEKYGLDPSAATVGEPAML